MGVISHKTILDNHPWVKDANKEKEQLDKEGDEYTRNLPSVSSGSSTPNSSPKSSTDDEKVCSECGGSGEVTSEKTGKQITCRSCGGDGVIG